LGDAMSVRNVPPAIPKDMVTKEGTKVRIIKAEIVDEPIYTQLGQVTKALTLEVELNGQKYSHLFGLNRPVITGSAARLLASVGISDINAPDAKQKIKQLEGKVVTIQNRGGKLYWTV